MDLDDTYAMNRLDVFSNYKIERRRDVGDGPTWIVEVNESDPPTTFKSESHHSLASAIASLFTTIAHWEAGAAARLVVGEPKPEPKCCCPSVACPVHGLPPGSASGGW